MTVKRLDELGSLQRQVMEILWERGEATVAGVREATGDEAAYTTVLSVLQKLEKAGWVEHRAEGRTYVYSPKVASRSVATDAVRGIVDRFCNGSVESLLVGMIDDELITPEKLQELGLEQP